jgi:hypothetical protein
MMLRWSFVCLCMIALPALLLAQAPAPVTAPRFTETSPSPKTRIPDKLRRMYEDIEIFHRILKDRLKHTYAPAYTVNVNNGVYLNGYGIVYAIVAPSLKPTTSVFPTMVGATWSLDVDVVMGSNINTTVVDEWERIRQQIRQDKSDLKPEAAKPAPSLSDILLNLLAQYGGRFTQLVDSERITLVVFIQQPQPASLKLGESQFRTSFPTFKLHYIIIPSDPLLWAVPSPPSSPAAKDASTQGGAVMYYFPGNDRERKDRARDLELLGDLQLKHGRYQEALKAFQEASQLLPVPADTLARKLIQCHLLLGQDEEAQRQLEALLARRKKTATNKEKTSTPDRPVSMLPVRLIISAPKRLLDQVHQRQLSLEEFRRQVQVELLRFDE